MERFLSQLVEECSCESPTLNRHAKTLLDIFLKSQSDRQNHMSYYKDISNFIVKFSIAFVWAVGLIYLICWLINLVKGN